MDLEVLNINSPIKHDAIDIVTDYVSCKTLKNIKLTAYSDIPCILQIQFVLNLPDPDHPYGQGPVNTLQVNNQWITRVVPSSLNYCRIRIFKLRLEDFQNELIVSCVGIPNNKIEIKPEYPPEEEKVELRSKSPFSRFKKGKTKEMSPSQDKRIPSLIPRNSILIGGYNNNNITTIPPPTNGVKQHLVFDGSIFYWEEIEGLPEPSIKWKV
jgi:hypothetical protein